MSQVNSVGGTRGGNPIDATNDVSTSGARACAPTTLLPEPSAGGDIGFVIAKLVIENAFASRKTAREDKQSAMTTMVAAQSAQVEELHKQAEQNFKAATCAAIAQIATGSAGIVGGVMHAQAAWKDTEAARKAGAAWGDVVKSGGELNGGIADLIGAFEKKSADEAGARAKAAENQASIAKMAVDDASDEVKEARQHVNTALDFLRQFNETQTKSMAAAIRA